MRYSARKGLVHELFPWDGTIRSHAFVFAVIEWGDPTAYGARTRCAFCGNPGPTLGRHTNYVDAARFARAHAPGLVRDSPEDRAAGDKLERDMTVEQSHGRITRGPTRPICPSCGSEILHRFLSEGRRGSARFVTEVPAKGWTALVRLAEPGPDAWTQGCAITGFGKPDVMALVRFLSSQPYEMHAAMIDDDAGKGSVVSLLADDEDE